MKRPTRVTVDITEYGWTTKIYSGDEVIDQQDMKRSNVGFRGNSMRNMQQNFPDFEEQFISDIDPASIAMDLEDFALIQEMK